MPFTIIILSNKIASIGLKTPLLRRNYYYYNNNHHASLSMLKR